MRKNNLAVFSGEVHGHGLFMDEDTFLVRIYSKFYSLGKKDKKVFLYQQLKKEIGTYLANFPFLS